MGEGRYRFVMLWKRWALLGIGLVTWGCGHPMQRKLEGRWLGQGVENVEDRDFAGATGWAKGVSMEFAGATLTVAVPAKEPRSGSYKIVSVHGGDIQLAVAGNAGKSYKARFKLDDDHNLRWVIGDSRTVLLRRED